MMRLTACERDGLDARTEDFGDVGARVERAGRDGGNVGVDALTDDVRQGEVDDEDLDQKRRAADHVDVDFGGPTEDGILRKLGKTEEKADDQAETHGERRDFKRQARALEKQGKAVDDQG